MPTKSPKTSILSRQQNQQFVQYLKAAHNSVQQQVPAHFNQQQTKRNTVQKRNTQRMIQLRPSSSTNTMIQKNKHQASTHNRENPAVSSSTKSSNSNSSSNYFVNNANLINSNSLQKQKFSQNSRTKAQILKSQYSMNDLFDQAKTATTSSAVGAVTTQSHISNNNYHPHPPRDGMNTQQNSVASSIHQLQQHQHQQQWQQYTNRRFKNSPYRSYWNQKVLEEIFNVQYSAGIGKSGRKSQYIGKRSATSQQSRVTNCSRSSKNLKRLGSGKSQNDRGGNPFTGAKFPRQSFPIHDDHHQNLYSEATLSDASISSRQMIRIPAAQHYIPQTSSEQYIISQNSGFQTPLRQQQYQQPEDKSILAFSAASKPGYNAITPSESLYKKNSNQQTRQNSSLNTRRPNSASKKAVKSNSQAISTTNSKLNNNFLPQSNRSLGSPYQRSAAMMAKRQQKQRQKLLINVLTGNAVGSSQSQRHQQPHPPPSSQSIRSSTAIRLIPNKSLQHLYTPQEQQSKPNQQQGRIPSTSVSMSALRQVPYSMPMPGVIIGGKSSSNIYSRKKLQQPNFLAAVSTLSSLQQQQQQQQQHNFVHNNINININHNYRNDQESTAARLNISKSRRKE